MNNASTERDELLFCNAEREAKGRVVRQVELVSSRVAPDWVDINLMYGFVCARWDHRKRGFFFQVHTYNELPLALLGTHIVYSIRESL